VNLNGNTLIISNGALYAGYGINGSAANITNGTLQLGTASKPAAMYIGQNTVLGQHFTTAAVVVVIGTLVSSNLSAINVGVSPNLGNGTYAYGYLDLSQAQINSPGGSNTFQASGNVAIGYVPNDTACSGTLLMPPTLKSFSCSTLYVGYGVNTPGILNWGQNSALTNLTIAGDFLLGTASGYAIWTNFPTNVFINVGSSSYAAKWNVGCQDNNRQGYAWYAQIYLTNDVINAWLSTLEVGYNAKGGNTICATPSILDIASSTLICRNATNALFAGTAIIGSKYTYNSEDAGDNTIGTYSTGTLKIPAAVTNATFNTLVVGGGMSSFGVLDISPTSQLQSITVSNGFYLGGGVGIIGCTNGSGVYGTYFPTGLNMTVGTPTAPCPMWIGHRPIQIALPPTDTAYLYGTGVVSLAANSTFAGRLSTLRIGVKEDSTRTVTGTLNLTNATVTALNVSDSIWVGGTYGMLNGGGVTNGNQNGSGYLYLPACSATVASNLVVGCTNPASYGKLEMFGTSMTVSNQVIVMQTGSITTYVGSASCGLGITSSATNNLTILSGGNIAINFANSAAVNGFKWAGNNVTALTNLIAQGKITIGGAYGGLASTYYDGSAYTFIGIQAAGGSTFVYPPGIRLLLQ
jgi:hypothetical protein